MSMLIDTKTVFAFLKIMNDDISNVGLPHTFPPGKIYWKKYWEKLNNDTINWEKLCYRSADHR